MSTVATTIIVGILAGVFQYISQTYQEPKKPMEFCVSMTPRFAQQFFPKQFSPEVIKQTFEHASDLGKQSMAHKKSDKPFEWHIQPLIKAYQEYQNESRDLLSVEDQNSIENYGEALFQKLKNFYQKVYFDNKHK